LSTHLHRFQVIECVVYAKLNNALSCWLVEVKHSSQQWCIIS